MRSRPAGAPPWDHHWVLGGAGRCFLVYQLGIRVPSLPHLCGWAAWIPHGGWPRPADLVARTSLSCSGLPAQAPALETKSTVESGLTLAEQRDRTTHILAQTPSFKATGIWLVLKGPLGPNNIKVTASSTGRARSHRGSFDLRCPQG